MARPRYIHDPTALRIAHFRLYELGYRLTNVYGDGVLNYTRPDGMMVFATGPVPTTPWSLTPSCSQSTSR
jgi:hypothetical protein